MNRISIKIWLPIIVVTLAIFAFLVYSDWMKTINSFESIQLQSASAEKPVPQIPSDWKTYRNEEIGIEFQYPAEWGALHIEEELCTFDNKSFREYQGKPCVHIYISVSSIGRGRILLASQSESFVIYTPGRGAYFGDSFTLARKFGTAEAEEFVRTYCTTKRTEKCEFKTNLNGILYVKSLEEVPLMDYPDQPPKALYYFIYQSHHEFSGIVLSNERFRGTSFQLNSEDEFDKILSTFKFLE